MSGLSNIELTLVEELDDSRAYAARTLFDGVELGRITVSHSPLDGFGWRTEGGMHKGNAPTLERAAHFLKLYAGMVS